MKRMVAVLALLTAASPALAGGDWNDGHYEDDYYERHHWRGEYRDAYGDPYRSSSYGVYIPYYGAYFADEPAYPANCEVERKWHHGHYREKIECDDDD
jgi:hypothetical protein